MLPMTSRLACLVPAFALVVQIGQANAQSLPPAKPGGAALHHAAKAKLRVAASAAPAPGGQGRATEASFGHMDDWFSYGPPKEAEVEREAPGVQIKAHDPREDDIIVYGVRQKRDFEGAAPGPDLTSPRALEAAQPMVPGIGDSCSYKTGCFDMSQTPLRSAAGFGGGD